VSIASLADIAAGLRQTVFAYKTPIGTSANLFTTWLSAGIPGAGAAAGNLTAGMVPTSATAGAWPIMPFSGDGYIIGAHLTDDIGGMFIVADRVFACGAYTANASQVLTGQPSYAARIPRGDYSGTQIWIENFGGVGGTPSITVTYTDQDGNTGHSTGAWPTNNVGLTASVIPLAPGDTGVQKIESVAMTGVGAGNWQIVVLRPLMVLASWPNKLHYSVTSIPLEALGMPQVFSDSCLCMYGRTVSNSAHTASLSLDLVSG
jgi:hypothetical protein